jgi:hypothetical protein
LVSASCFLVSIINPNAASIPMPSGEIHHA